MFHVPSPTLKNLLNNLAQMLLLGLLGFYDYDQPMKLHKTICFSMTLVELACGQYTIGQYTINNH